MDLIVVCETYRGLRHVMTALSEVHTVRVYIQLHTMSGVTVVEGGGGLDSDMRTRGSPR